MLLFNFCFINKFIIFFWGGGFDGWFLVLLLKGVGILFFIYYLYWNEFIYGLDLGVYCLERWEDGELIKKVKFGVGYIDFNIGLRFCLGSKFFYCFCVFVYLLILL